MSHSSYPTSSDLRTNLEAAGLSIGSLPVDAGIAAGIAEFETYVGGKMKAVAGVRYFDRPTNSRGAVDFGEWAATVTQITCSGQVLTLNEDYWLKPDNAPDRGRPYRYVEIYNRWAANPLLASARRAIAVTGTWGWGATIPDDAWYAMIARGAYSMLPILSAAISSGLVSWSEAGVQENYGAQPLIYLGETWTQLFTDIAGRYRDVRAGI